MNLSSRTILLPAIALLVGAVVSTTTASNAYAQDPFDNEINRDIDVKHTNSCDESGNGDNTADCEFEDSNNIGEINVEGENNEVNSDVDLKHTNDCDESGDGDNDAFCLDSSSTDIDDINIQEVP
jgi:hypothetical protein